MGVIKLVLLQTSAADVLVRRTRWESTVLHRHDVGANAQDIGGNSARRRRVLSSIKHDEDVAFSLSPSRVPAFGSLR